MKLELLNKGFLIVFLALICCTGCTKAMSMAGVDFPDWTGIGKERSNLEGRRYEALPSLSVEGIMSAEFQDETEQFLADAFPMRDSALVANAALQRVGIEMSSLVFGYDVYPTYYGSSHVYDARNDTVSAMLTLSTEEHVEEYEAAAKKFSSFADRHLGLNVLIYRTDRVNFSSNNPTHDLVSASLDTEFFTDHFYGLLGERVTVVDGSGVSEEERLNLYYKTDHHWDIEGAYLGYSQIAAELGVDPRDRSNFEHVVFSNVEFYGSYSRSGLCLPDEPDVISDYWFDGGEVEVAIDGKPATMEDLVHYRMYSDGNADSEWARNRYAEYYHADYGLIELTNDSAVDRTLLIVADSYSNSMERYFAIDFGKVYVFDARHAGMTVDEFLAEHHVDDVVFLLSQVNHGDVLAALE